MMAAMGTLFTLVGFAVFRGLGRPRKPQANRPPVADLLRMSRQQGAARISN